MKVSLLHRFTTNEYPGCHKVCDQSWKFVWRPSQPGKVALQGERERASDHSCRSGCLEPKGRHPGTWEPVAEAVG